MMSAFFIAFANVRIWLQNAWRRMVRRRIDYLLLELTGELPEFAPQPPWWQRRFLGTTPPLSLIGLRRMFQRLADDPQAKGVVLYIHDLGGGWATVESLRTEIHSLRRAGKQVLAYLHSASTREYLVACAADKVLLSPVSYLNLIGTRLEVQFLGDALRMAGIEAEVFAVSPYKSGADQFARGDMSPESREQYERLLDQIYDYTISTVAEERKLTPEATRKLIDCAPFQAPAAHEAGLIDGTCYEDELEAWLAAGLNKPVPAAATKDKDGPTIKLLRWKAAARALQLPYRKRHIIGGSQAGSDSLVQALRQAERNEQIAALVLHVDSPGGDAFASDLIWREVLRLRQKKPVVVSMGNAAASGGYYVAAPANAIVAHRATLTGSIGVFSLRPTAADLLERLNINTVVLSRGARTGLLGTLLPLTEDERETSRRVIFELYAEFKQRVREGRRLTEAQLEPIAGGRVWSGGEAKQLGLVDEIGGLPVAIAKARELAKLEPDPRAPILLVSGGGKGGKLLPLPFPKPENALHEMTNLFDEAMRPRMLAALPWVLRER
ncbi:MAG: S49 family peptidase [Chloroflexaceae bacterium]|nr:S49 family peptidase [Chloroflexaceae bacterium]